jgi:hypothetical protein
LVPAVGLVADTGIHACVLLRVLLVFVDGQHTTALRSYMKGVSRWSLWFDARANSGALQAATLWVSLSFALLLFALTAVGGVQLGSADRLRNEWHVLLSYLVLIPGLMLRCAREPRAAVPRLALILNGLASVWALVGGSAAASLSFAAALLLMEAWTAHRPAYTETNLACAFEVASHDFEEHLATERRLTTLYCLRELEVCEASWQREERLEKWRAWIGRFVVDGAPFQVPALSAMIGPLEEKEESAVNEPFITCANVELCSNAIKCGRSI